MTTTTIREKKKRGLVSLMNQFSLEVKTSSATVEVLPGRQSVSFTERLNAMIAAGASFNVSIDDFQICGAGNLSEAEKEFLTVNKISVLCTLQQGLLVKHLFSQKPELRQTFVTKVEERGADFEAVREITAKWFARLLDTMSDRGDNFYKL